MSKAQNIAAEINRALAGKSELFAGQLPSESGVEFASFLAGNVQNVGLYWLGTACSQQPSQPVAQVWQLRRYKRSASDHYSRVLGYVRRADDGTWYATGV